MIDTSDSHEREREVVHLIASFRIEHRDDRSATQILSQLATIASSLPGCRGCTLTRASDAHAPLVLHEEWDSEDRLKCHIESEGFQSTLAHFGSSLRKPGETPLADGITLRFTRTHSPLGLDGYSLSLANTNKTSI
jgi:quinol monooxygenase YgiN